MQDQQSSLLSVAGLFVRLYWMFASNAIMVFLLMFIIQKHANFPSFFDLAYWIIAGSQVLVRYLDIRFLNGQTATGDPATLAHWRRYALLAVLVAFGVWIVARGIEVFFR